MKYLYTMTVDDKRIKDSFLETVKKPLQMMVKEMNVEDIDSEGNVTKTLTRAGIHWFKPITLKMDTCTGVELEMTIELKLYNKKTQAVMFTMEGFPLMIDRKNRKIKFHIRHGNIGI